MDLFLYIFALSIICASHTFSRKVADSFRGSFDYEPWNQTVGGLAREMGITVSV